MRVDVVTIFPEYLEPLNVSLVGKARARGLLDVRVHDLRHWTHDRHHTVDDTPYGGGPGMVMKPEPWGEALDEIIASAEAEPEAEAGAESEAPVLIVPTPSGRPFTQELAVELSALPWLVFTPARYEGIDRRVIEEYGERLDVREVSIGDYVLAGGESAALVMVEAVTRLIPGVVGNADSVEFDSHADGLLEGPSYTRPATWRDLAVPPVLLSGDHAAIARWRRAQSLRRTADRRPDLLAALPDGALDAADRAALDADPQP
jgi:tRNA (guanine37-N1)-methyltransferase